MKRYPYALFTIGLWLLCHTCVAQSFNSLKKAPAATFNASLGTLLDDCDNQGMKAYLQQNPQAVNDASAVKKRKGFSGKEIINGMPLLYDAIQRTLGGKCEVAICQTIINANCNLMQPFNGKTPIYIVLDFIATHPKQECTTAEELLSLILSRPDFDVKSRHKTLLPPFAYLIRENHTYLENFSPNYISDNVLRMFIEKGAPVNTYDEDGNSLMIFAMNTNNEYLQDYFISQGIDVTKSGKDGHDAIYHAIDRGQLSLLKQMLSKGVELNINNLKNAPDTFRQFEDVYDFLAERFAQQATSYEEIKFFVSKFNDCFTLVQPKLYAIYQKEYNELVEKHRQEFASIINDNTDAVSIGNKVLKIKDMAKEMYTFIGRHSEYDPDNRVILANEMIDINSVCMGLVQEIPNSYLDTKYERFLLDLFIDTSKIIEKESRLVIYEDKHKGQYLTILKAYEKALTLLYNNTFNCTPFFEEAVKKLVDIDKRRKEIWAQNIVVWNEYVDRTKAEKERIETAHRKYYCEACELDKEKTRYPKEVHKDAIFFEYTEEKPGVFMTKNGLKQEFYWNKNKKCWYTVEGFIFTRTESFDDLEELVKQFLKKCRDEYCGD